MKQMPTTEETTASQGIEEAIGRMENLYRTVTGQSPPSEGVHTPIPVERDPSQFVEEQLDRLLALLSPLERQAASAAWSPPLSVWENETEFLVCIDLPGVARKDVEVSIQGEALTVRGSRPAAHVKEYQLRASEWPMGSFVRKILLPPGVVRTAEPSAHMKEGVLEIRITREPPAAANAKAITVN
jgi:HSP20 family protein